MKIPMPTLVEFTTYLKEYFGYLYLGFDEEFHHFTDQEHLNTPDVKTTTDGYLWLVFEDNQVAVPTTQMARMVIEFLIRNPNVEITAHTGYPFD